MYVTCITKATRPKQVLQAKWKVIWKRGIELFIRKE